MLPLWATTTRRAWLIELFRRSKMVDMPHDIKGFCLRDKCLKMAVPEDCMPEDCNSCRFCRFTWENYIEAIIAYWKVDDRLGREALWKIERRRMHSLPDEKGWGRRFDPIAKEKFAQRQQHSYIEAVGISGLTFKPIAKVRVPSTHERLFVEIQKPLSKNARRKAARYGRPITIDDTCREAIEAFWDIVQP